MRRQLAALADAPQAKARPCMIVSQPAGFDKLTHQEQINLWERHAVGQQAALMAATSPDRNHTEAAA